MMKLFATYFIFSIHVIPMITRELSEWGHHRALCFQLTGQHNTILPQESIKGDYLFLTPQQKLNKYINRI